ncbi:hypothetical protein BH23THE1_BH23THE1_00530 [soil metagenome]
MISVSQNQSILFEDDTRDILKTFGESLSNPCFSKSNSVTDVLAPGLLRNYVLLFVINNNLFTNEKEIDCFDFQSMY